MIILINVANSECSRIIIEGKIISTSFYDDNNCTPDILVEKVIQGYGLGAIEGMKLVPGIKVWTWTTDCSNLQVGDCVEVYGSWCVTDSPPVYRIKKSDIEESYIKEIECSSRPDSDDETPKCSPSPIGSPQCSGNSVQQLYQDVYCNQYWQTVDDCSRYIPSKCCNSGRCDECGGQETYRCVNNVVQRLVVNNGVEEWQVFDDCNSYDPPRRCIGGVCIKDDDPEPEEECNQAECWKQNGPVGESYLKDGRMYQRYSDCNCVGSECQCSVVEKEEIIFTGTYVSEQKLIGGSSDIIKIDNVEVGPSISGSIAIGYWIIAHPDRWVAGKRDSPLENGDRVKVYAIYEELLQNPTAFGADHAGTIIGDKKYYIRKHIEAESKFFKLWVGDKDSKNLPGAEVFIDGVSKGKTDRNGEVRAEVTFGQHTFSAKADCGEASKDYEFNASIDGVTLTIDSCPVVIPTQEECQDIEFEGEVIETGTNSWDPECQGIRAYVEYPYYVIKIKKTISSVKPREDTIHLQVGPYWKSDSDCSINPIGSYDDNIIKGDIVRVFGCYAVDGPRVSISEKDYYYIKKLASDENDDLIKGKISGHVYDAVTKMPIPDAVICDYPGYLCTACPTTDDQGYYQLPTDICDFRPFTSYDIHCFAYHYGCAIKSGTTDKDGNAVIDFYLEKVDPKTIRFSGTFRSTDTNLGDQWTVDIDEIKVETETCSQDINVIGYSFGDPISIRGYIDKTIQKGDKVDVYGEYICCNHYDDCGCQVLLSGSKNYYITKLNLICDGYISGKVINPWIITGKDSIPGATILCLDQPDKSTISDDNGNYRLGPFSCPYTEYQISCGATGFKPNIQRVMTDILGNAELNFELVPDSSGPIDSDQDDLPDWKEKIAGTDPNEPDKDGDGLKDGEELNGRYIGDMRVLIHYDENTKSLIKINDLISWDKFKNDYNGDNIDDSRPVTGRYLERDLDNDGDCDLDDEKQVFYLSPLVVKTNPHKPDTDDDGLDDFVDPFPSTLTTKWEACVKGMENYYEVQPHQPKVLGRSVEDALKEWYNNPHDYGNHYDYDNDGLSDWVEDNYFGTKPGVEKDWNGVQFVAKINNDAYDTNCNGLSDLQEIMGGSDPTGGCQDTWKRLAFISFSEGIGRILNTPIDMGVSCYFDYADMMGYSKDGKEGWVTLWMVHTTETGLDLTPLPFDAGFVSLHITGDEDNDDINLASPSILPGMQVTFYDTDGAFHLNPAYSLSYDNQVFSCDIKTLKLMELGLTGYKLEDLPSLCYNGAFIDWLNTNKELIAAGNYPLGTRDASINGK